MFMDLHARLQGQRAFDDLSERAEKLPHRLPRECVLDNDRDERGMMLAGKGSLTDSL